MTALVTAGELFLKAEREALRLRWAPDGSPRARVVAAGTYTVFGYRLVDGDWMLSSSGGEQRVDVQAGRRLALTLDATIRLALAARREPGGKLRVQLGITNTRGAGLSLYRGGTRLRLTYSCLDATGQELVTGALDYG